MKPHLILTAIVMFAAACSEPVDTALHGYAEGNFISIAPDMPGRIVETGAIEGQTITAGAMLVRLDDTTQRNNVQTAQARLEAATARFDDALAGARAPEIAAARDQLTQARAAQTEARDARARVQDLFDRGHVSQARLDTSVAANETADARVAEMRQRLSLVQLPARENALRALQAEVSVAQSGVEQAEYALSLRTITAPIDARVNQQIRFVGEQAGPAQPVYSVLPTGHIHAILFIPETDLASTPVGTAFAVSCDGCDAGLSARITRIDDNAEFTPPIIYSDAERARLVYRAEARFDGPAPPPGMPLQFEPR